MSETTKSYVKPTSNSQTTTISGHGTTVVPRVATMGGRFVDKTVNPDGVFKDAPDKWMQSNIDARSISDEIRARHNPAYDVPKTFISHGKVREQFAAGQMMRTLSMEYLQKNLNTVRNAFANFINDMSELRPVRRSATPAATLPKLGVKDVDDLDKQLARAGELLAPWDRDIIHDVFIYLRDLPENNEYVFAHNDLHGGNVIIDPATGRVTIIDFELAGYASKLATMLRVPMAGVWNIVNKLPRTTNPNLHWDFNPDVNTLFLLLRRTMARVRRAIRERAKSDANALDRIRREAHDDLKEMRLLFSQLRVKARSKNDKIPAAALVKANHWRGME